MADQDGIDPRHDPIFQRGYDPALHGDPRAEVPPPSTRRSRARRDADLDLFAPPSSRSSDPRGTGTTTGAPIETAPRWGSDESSTRPVTARPARIAPPPGGTADDDEPDHSLFLAPSVTADAESRSGARSESPTETLTSPAPPWRNPYLLGLVIGGAVLALAGFQMFRSALETIYVDFAQAGFIFGGGDTGSEEDPDPTAELVSMQLGWSLGPLLFVIGLAAILAVVIFVAVRWRPVGARSELREADGGDDADGDGPGGNADGAGVRP